MPGRRARAQPLGVPGTVNCRMSPGTNSNQARQCLSEGCAWRVLQFYEHVRQLLDAIVLERAGDRDARLTGTLRIRVPSAGGRRHACPLVPAFLR